MISLQQQTVGGHRRLRREREPISVDIRGRCNMAMPVVQGTRSEPFAIWTMAFRPFFLAASV
jgi:hypothetical protein